MVEARDALRRASGSDELDTEVSGTAGMFEAITKVVDATGRKPVGNTVFRALYIACLIKANWKLGAVAGAAIVGAVWLKWR
mmetsp:Transcript_24544/g.57970  ORF Transcript_24544/g.57970 Transcript_24544/m.57970 type:complete len:81 (+) Transcript_24544:1058-1300(+)